MATTEIPERIGSVISPGNNLNLGKPSNLHRCGICKKRYADSMLGTMCSVCFRKQAFSILPPEQQKFALLEVVPERYIDAEISHLKPGLQKVFNEEQDTGIYLWGEPGRGKTYAMAALAKKYITEGFNVRREHYEAFCLRLRDTFKPKAIQTEWSEIEPLLNCDKLFIEDVGVGKSIDASESDYSLRTFIVLLDMRLERMRPTFITSNKSLENLEGSFDARVGDRLRMFKIFKMAGESMRK